MRISFIKNDLHQIDRVSADTFFICVFEEEKPPRGVSGLLDWRLCGRISKMMASGYIIGRFRESMLFPSYNRIPTNRICLFGLGKVSEFTQNRAREACWFIADALQRLRASSAIGAIPGSPLSSIPIKTRMELFVEEVARVFGPDENGEVFDVILVEPTEYHRDLSEVFAITVKKMKGQWK